MNFLKPKYLPILLFFSSMSFSQMHPEGNCSGYAISGGKLDISKKDQICRFDNLIDYTYENFPENFLYRIGNSSEELDIYKSYKEMMEKFPEFPSTSLSTVSADTYINLPLSSPCFCAGRAFN